MYSMVLMAALTTGTTTPDFFFHHHGCCQHQERSGKGERRRYDLNERDNGFAGVSPAYSDQ